MRVLLAALGLSALSFAAGVAGDLSIASPSHPESVVVQIPPLPPNAVRAHPLPPLTDSAEAAEVAHAAPVIAPVHRHHVRRAHARRTALVTAPKPRVVQAFAVSKFDPRAAKWDI